MFGIPFEVLTGVGALLCLLIAIAILVSDHLGKGPTVIETLDGKGTRNARTRRRS